MGARRIYVASSWRNPEQPGVVERLGELGHEVYDFRNPRPGDTGFAWSDIDPEWLAWQPAPFRDALAHPVAQAGFKSDFDAMQWADTFVLALPCGRSAHLEAGWAIGAGKPTAILLHEDKFEPELMYLMADLIACDLGEVTDWLAEIPGDEVFPPETAISGENGGGGNRTRVTCPAESGLSSGNVASTAADANPRPLVTRAATVISTSGDLAAPIREPLDSRGSRVPRVPLMRQIALTVRHRCYKIDSHKLGER